MSENAFGGFAAHDFAQCVNSGAAEIRNAAEFAEKTLGGFWSYAGNFEERGSGLTFGAALAMESDGETMSLVANLLNQMQDGRMPIENDGFVFLAKDVENFFFLGDAGEGLINDLQRIESLRGGVELADASVDEN